MDSVKTIAALQDRYGSLDGAALLGPLIKREFPGRIALLSSFGTEAAVLLAMAADIDCAIPVIFLNTHKLFPETLDYCAQLTDTLGLKNVRMIYPDYADTVRQDPDGDLWQENPGGCCYIRKVKPLEKALKGFDAWITGRKQYQGGLRENLPVIEPFQGRIKINPLARWRMKDIQAAFTERHLPVHPLAAQGYLSIGCRPCTALPVSNDDPRSGRWAGLDKTECGIHIDNGSDPERPRRRTTS